MNKQFWAGLIAATCTASLGLAAQTTGSATPPASQSASNQITVTGCIQRGSGSTSGATGTSGTTGAASSSDFILTNASSSPSSASSTSSTSSSAATGTTGATSASPSSSAG